MRNYSSVIIASALLVSSCGSCKKESSKTAPDIYINGTTFHVGEDDPAHSITIPVALSASSDKQVTVDFNTADSSAIAGRDYVAVSSNKLVFEPGQTSKTITVSILADADSKADTYFRILLSNPVNGNLKGNKAIVHIINIDYATLVWSDEFENGPLNSSSWNYEQGATGWGNNELENYTNSINNVHIDSGYLHISALNPSENSYTSGRITTQGKKEFTYGRIDIRAKLPEGKGIWPALWMLGGNFATAGWPACGEIDIMELLGQSPALVHGTVHWNLNGHQSRTGDFTLPTGTFSSGFHIFSLIWTPNSFKWLVDNNQYYYLGRGEISAFPFDLPEFFIFNVAVGGNWPGPPDQTTVFPQHMIVDYIRVYQ